MKRIGSHTIGVFPSDPVRIECERCGRAGRYAKARLIERFGADAAGPDVLMDWPHVSVGRTTPVHAARERFTNLVAKRT